MPIDYTRYPENWVDLRQQVLMRANNKCEFCGVHNGDCGIRDKNGEFILMTQMDVELAGLDIKRWIRIVLTVAHLDHDEENENVSIDRLRALCQRCHLRYDINEKKRRKKAKKAIGDLFQ